MLAPAVRAPAAPMSILVRASIVPIAPAVVTPLITRIRLAPELALAPSPSTAPIAPVVIVSVAVFPLKSTFPNAPPVSAIVKVASDPYLTAIVSAPL